MCLQVRVQQASIKAKVENTSKLLRYFWHGICDQQRHCVFNILEARNIDDMDRFTNSIKLPYNGACLM